jgi:NDP-sugar pyrophosphorylase family protein
MRAMILAAGLGTRLRPLTNDRPKALVEIKGRTLLEITLRRLHSFGINEVIVNVHHFADRVVECIEANDQFGMKIEISREEDLLDTGGGLKKAAHFFLNGSDEPFILHNVDALSSIDLAEMVRFHREHQALATLAVQQRESSRQLLFDENLKLCGRRAAGEEAEVVRSSQRTEALAFCGIHVISPRIFDVMREENAFPIIPAYLRLAGEGEEIAGFRADQYYWRDVGTIPSLTRAAKDIELQVLKQ